LACFSDFAAARLSSGYTQTGEHIDDQQYCPVTACWDKWAYAIFGSSAFKALGGCLSFSAF
jgi:hypothetical protein